MQVVLWMLYRRRQLALLLVLCASLAWVLPASGQRPAEPFEAPVLDPRGDLTETGRLVRLLVPYSRAYYFLDGARERGASYEVGKRFERDLNRGRKPGQEIHVTFFPVAHDQLITALVEGRGDVTLFPLAPTAERRKLVDFSEPIAPPANDVVVTGPGAGELMSLEDLAGRPAWVRPSSSYRVSLEQLNKRFRKERLAPIEIRDIDEHLDAIEVLELMSAGVIDITIMDELLAELWTPVFDGVEPRLDLVVEEGSELAFAFRKNSPRLAAAVNEFIRETRDSGFARDVDLRYLQQLTWIKGPSSTAERRKLDGVMPVFLKYGERYDLDPLLLAAMGYQESRLVQSASSRVGAIGVMQLMPATGTEMKVGDIHQLDNNVHAGAKYIRLLMDRFLTGDLTSLDRHLLAFASYNAGPGRIRKLRRKAEEEGLDPDAWFDNVELVVARHVGRETVGYVSSIYKYYLAYTWTLEAEERTREGKRAAGGA